MGRMNNATERYIAIKGLAACSAAAEMENRAGLCESS